MTELSSASLVQLVDPVLDVDVVAPAFDASPPDDLAAAGRYWERREGMRGRVRAGALVTGGRDVFASTADAEMWLVDAATGCRTARRPVRPPRLPRRAPAGQPARARSTTATAIASCSGRIGVKATAGDNARAAAAGPGLRHARHGASSAASTSRSTSTASSPRSEPAFTPGVDPSRERAAGAVRPQRRAQRSRTSTSRTSTTTATTRSTAATSPGNAGCPGVAPPFDYVPDEPGCLRRAPRRARGADRRRPARAGHPARAGGRGPGHLHGRRRRARMRHDEQRRRQAGHAAGARARGSPRSAARPTTRPTTATAPTTAGSWPRSSTAPTASSSCRRRRATRCSARRRA